MDAVMTKGHMMHTLDTLRHRYSLRHLVEDDVKASVLYNVPPCDVSVEIVKVKTLPLYVRICKVVAYSLGLITYDHITYRLA